MKTCYFIFILLTLLFQVSWATMSNYCQHEKGVAAQHFGHHEHQHHVQNDDDDKNRISLIQPVDQDCTYSSHFSFFALPFFTLAIAPASTYTFVKNDSIILVLPSRPERPNWISLA